MSGRLYGVGVGPGDPDLVTLKAARIIAAADVVAWPVAPRKGASGVARAIAGPHLREGVLEEALVYPITTEATDHPGGYEGALVDFYDESAARLAAPWAIRRVERKVQISLATTAAPQANACGQPTPRPASAVNAAAITARIGVMRQASAATA